jgi:iron complex transport system permease protein
MTLVRARDRRPPVLRRVRRERVIGLGGLAVLLAAAFFASLAYGAESLPLGAVVRALTDPGTDDATAIVRDLRLPRTVLGLVAGLALGAAGALIQGHTVNPLADPGLLGISAGAAFAVVLGINLLGVTALTGYVWFAFAGAGLATVAVFAIASAGTGGATPVTLALAGMAISALLGSFTSAILLADEASLNAFRFWAVGSLSGREAGVTGQILPFVVVGLLLAWANTPALNALGLGEDVARALGVRVAAARAVGLAAIVLLCGAATAACGPIAFLGLVVPHLARLVTGPDHRWLVPYSALLGAVVLLGADVAGRLIARPGELQTGIVLAFLGAPAFVLLLRRKRLVQL